MVPRCTCSLASNSFTRDPYLPVSRGRDANEAADVADDRHRAADAASMHAASRYSRRPAAGPVRTYNNVQLMR